MTVPNKSFEKGRDKWTPERIAVIRERYRYEAETGDIINRVTGVRNVNWDTTGTYGRVEVKGRQFTLHQLAWFFIHGRPPASLIDHIDRQTNNNRPGNLREVSNQMNMTNRTDRAADQLIHPYGTRWVKDRPGVGLVYYFSNEVRGPGRSPKPYVIKGVLGTHTAAKIGKILQAAVMKGDLSSLGWLTRPRLRGSFIHWNGYGFECLSPAEARKRALVARAKADAALDQAVFSFMNGMEVKHAA